MKRPIVWSDEDYSQQESCPTLANSRWSNINKMQKLSPLHIFIFKHWHISDQKHLPCYVDVTPLASHPPLLLHTTKKPSSVWSHAHPFFSLCFPFPWVQVNARTSVSLRNEKNGGMANHDNKKDISLDTQHDLTQRT